MMKKGMIAAMLLIAVMLGSMAMADVGINNAYFPDPVFQNVVTGFDTNQDGILQDSEIAEADDLRCEGLGIRDLKGIEYFTDLTFLVCSNNEITSLDFSGNKKLRVVYCENNRLSSLNVAENAKLECLDCQDNQLKKLDVTHNPKMEGLSCYHNQLTRLDISRCKILVALVTSTGGYTNFGTYSEWAGGDYNIAVDNSVKLITKPSDTSSDDYAVGGLKYRLSGSKAIVIGAKSKTAKTLAIPATIHANGKTYKVTEIKAGAFKGMMKLTAVTIGENVKTIGKNAFNGCTKLKTITIKTKKLTSSSVKANAFKGIYKKATFKCPKGKTADYKKILIKRGAPKTSKFR